MRPVIKPGSHPLEKKKYILSTPSISALSGFIDESLDLNTGAILVGPSRFGKSKAIKYIGGEMRATYGNDVLVYSKTEAIHQTKSSEKQFFLSLLKGVDHSMLSGDSHALRDRLLKFIISEVKKISGSKIIFFIDEAQNWGISEFKWLVEVGNEIEHNDLYFIAFLVGEPELIHNRTLYETTGGNKIINRFMTRTFEFRGIRNLKDMEYILEGYDNDSEYPHESGYSYTRYFCEKYFDLGWRIKNESGKLLQAFREIRERKNLPVIEEIPIVHLVRAVEKLLLKTELKDDGFSYEDCKNAVLKSGYIEGHKYIKLISDEDRISNISNK